MFKRVDKLNKEIEIYLNNHISLKIDLKKDILIYGNYFINVRWSSLKNKIINIERINLYDSIPIMKQFN